MNQLIREIEENISGIWENKKYQLVLGLDFSFFLVDKTNDSVVEGKYVIVRDIENGLIILRLDKDYLLKELSAFKSLTISHESKTLHLKNVPPDEYEGEIFNPAEN